MVSDPNQVIVMPEAHSGLLIHGMSAHHRDFPEVHAEGDSAKAAAQRLAELLARSLDNAPSDWRRQNLEQAIEDVRAFAASDR
jgi:hypothetical protein